MTEKELNETIEKTKGRKSGTLGSGVHTFAPDKLKGFYQGYCDRLVDTLSKL